MANETKPGRDYNVPDPAPVDLPTKYILELYAAEIREHASGILAIYGLSPPAVDIYKRHCFAACRELEAAAMMLRQDGNVRDVTIVKEAPPVAVPQVIHITPEQAEQAKQTKGWSLLGKFFARGVAPCLLVVALGRAMFFFFPSFRTATAAWLGL